MTPNWNEPVLKIIGRWGLVLLAIFVLFVLSMFPFRLTEMGEIRPAFMLMAVYYWAIMRPTPPLVAFFVGFFLDLLLQYPPGMNAFVFVLTHWVTRNQRKFLMGQPFMVIWAGFALTALVAGILQWLLFALLDQAVAPIVPVLVSIAFTVFLFPLMAAALAVVHKAMMEDPGVDE